MVYPLIIAAAALQGYGQGKKSKFLLQKEKEDIAAERKFQFNLETIKQKAEIEGKQLEAQIDILKDQKTRQDNAEPNSIFFLGSEMVDKLTGREGTTFVAIPKSTGQDTANNLKVTKDLFTRRSIFLDPTKDPSTNTKSTNTLLADLFNQKALNPNNPYLGQAVDQAMASIGVSLTGLVESTKQKEQDINITTTETTTGTKKNNTVIKNVVPFFIDDFKLVLGQIDDPDMKKEFIDGINLRIEQAYRGRETDGTQYRLYDFDVSKPSNEENLTLNREGPNVNVSPEDDNLKFAIDVALSNPYKDPDNINLIVDGQETVQNTELYKGTVERSVAHVKTIQGLIEEKKLSIRAGAPYIESLRDQQKYDDAVGALVNTYGIAGAADIISTIVPADFGSRLGTAEFKEGQTDEQFRLENTLPPRPHTIQFYKERDELLGRVQVSLNDTIDIVTEGKPILGAAAPVFTTLYGVFSKGGQIDQFFRIFDAFGLTSDEEDEIRGTWSDKEIQESADTISYGRDKLREFQKQIAAAEGNNTEREKIIKQMYSDTILMRYLQVEIVYNIARTLENPDGSGARLSRTDIDQMMQGTNLGGKFNTKEGIVAIVSYLQQRNNRPHQIAKYLSDSNNYNNPKKSFALEMVLNSKKIESKGFGQGRYLSEDPERALDELEGFITNAIFESRKEAIKVMPGLTFVSKEAETALDKALQTPEEKGEGSGMSASDVQSIVKGETENE